MKIIDPHLHLFNLAEGQYGWLQPENPPYWDDKPRICRDFSEQDLVLPSSVTLGGFVHIEAGFDNHNPWREIAWLEKACTTPLRTIGCVDLTLPKSAFDMQIAALTGYKSLVGVRHILDDDAIALLSNAQVLQNLATLEKERLIFEAQFDANDSSDVDMFLRAIQRFPALNIALNHAGFPPPSGDENWKANGKKLASLPNLYVKASGWEMSDREFPLPTMADRIQSLVDTFGEDRVMLASNFPLTLFRTSYASLWQAYLSLGFPHAVLEKLCYQNACRFYRF